MRGRRWLGSAWLLIGASGCLSPDAMTLVAPHPFDYATNAPTAVSRVAFNAASTEAAARVDVLGRKLVAANSPRLGLKPTFITIGAPQPEIFHRGTTEVYVTEGLVKQCPGDGALAAVLSLELGRMVSEREALAGPKARVPERLPPMDVPVGNDAGASFGAPDHTHLAELAKFDRERHEAKAAAALPPDPNALARAYLKKADFAETELDAAAPIITAASQNSALEKQLHGGPTPPQWGK